MKVTKKYLQLCCDKKIQSYLSYKGIKIFIERKLIETYEEEEEGKIFFKSLKRDLDEDEINQVKKDDMIWIPTLGQLFNILKREFHLKETDWSRYLYTFIQWLCVRQQRAFPETFELGNFVIDCKSFKTLEEALITYIIQLPESRYKDFSGDIKIIEEEKSLVEKRNQLRNRSNLKL